MPFIGAAVLNDGGYQFAVVIRSTPTRCGSIGTSFATPSIRSVAKTAICAEVWRPRGTSRGVGRRPDWISRRTGWLGRGWRSCLVGAGFLRWSGSGGLLCDEGRRA